MTISIVTILLTIQNLPSTCAVNVYNWNIQSLAGLLIRKLNAVDSARIWKIGRTEKTKYINLPLVYYLQFGYKYQPPKNSRPDILVLHKTEESPNTIYLDRHFFDKFNCLVAVNPNLVKNNVFPAELLSNE